jgi:leucyl/phenylalanyl-tRNA--protein transferase
MILETSELIVNRSLRKAMRRRPYRITADEAFARVVQNCAATPRPGQSGTWITRDMQAAYVELHERGFAHSVEAWRGDDLVGGLYGVCLGSIFCGESMFARSDNASKIAFVTAVRQLDRWGIGLIDCQMHTQHLERFGAHEIPRAEFLQRLEACLQLPTRRGLWRLDEDLLDELASDQ